ncbi:hypothetical protein DPEC_G00301880 [Dallia pectoralis]|uniref:Uncharacterized protein n=1 Tax=Dallia pectoralis TaxID=75939 RepID=A0ACC2FGX4_DALPE|nr:hypothetical protein DPEC_G00301880 [Dallia pectoralis]
MNWTGETDGLRGCSHFDHGGSIPRRMSETYCDHTAFGNSAALISLVPCCSATSQLSVSPFISGLYWIPASIVSLSG